MGSGAPVLCKLFDHTILAVLLRYVLKHTFSSINNMGVLHAVLTDPILTFNMCTNVPRLAKNTRRIILQHHASCENSHEETHPFEFEDKH